MSRVSLWVCALLVLSACPKKEEASREPDRQLVQQIKSGLAERERKLHAFRLEGTVTEAGQTARFTIDYRAPNRLRGTLRTPPPPDGTLPDGGQARGGEQTFVFDGERLYQLSPQQKTLTTFEIRLPPEKSALFLNQTFGPFVPEGFRAPVLNFDVASARRVKHARAPEAVELSSSTKDDAGGDILVIYVFRWPSLDLLEKRLTASGGTMTLTVTEEHCDKALGLCVPKRLVQHYGEQPGPETTLHEIALNEAIPQEAFTPTLPEGWTAERKELVEQ